MSGGNEKSSRRNARLISLMLLAPAVGCLGSPYASAQEAGFESPLAIEAEYRVDAVGVVQGERTGLRRVDFLAVTADLSLENTIGWQGAHIHAQAIASTGGMPNDLAATIQGINNVEVPDRRAKVFEAYLEQDLIALNGSLRIGFSDLNTEFCVNDSAGLLIAPAFGIGSELAATGPTGPSLFPSTALSARLRVEPAEQHYAQFAVVNAEAGVLGDRGGIAPLLDEGALLIAEAGTTRRGKVAVGAWTYTRRQADIRLTTPAGDPQLRRARGVYGLFEWPVVENDGRTVTFFARAGASDGATTPFTGGWQSGLLVDGVIAGRPDSQLSIGVNQAFLSSRYRRNSADEGTSLRHAETGVELTLADRILSWLTVQPDIQYVRTPPQAPASRDALVLTLRLIVTPQFQ